MPHILLVEDETALAQTLALNLKYENYEVSIASTGTNALNQFITYNQSLDLVLLDVMLPEINGYDLCEEFKKINSLVPVIFLTAKNQATERISGLRLGADDYINKPFELEELLLRIKNVIKRNSGEKESTIFKFGNCSVNFETFETLSYKGEKVALSKREIALLKLLTEKENKVVSRLEIIEKLWTKSESPSSRTIDNYILNFRKLFEENPKEPKHFHSIRAVGYKFTGD